MIPRAKVNRKFWIRLRSHLYAGRWFSALRVLECVRNELSRVRIESYRAGFIAGDDYARWRLRGR